MINMSDLHNYGLVRFNKRTGKIDKIMTAIGKGMIKLWGLQNTEKGTACIVVDIDERQIIVEYIGTNNGLPEIHTTPDKFVYELSEELLSVFDEEVAKRTAG